MKDKKFDLEDRLIDFTVSIIKFIENLPASKSALHLGGQLLRARIYKTEQEILSLLKECNELISIFVKSIVTATKK